MRGHAWTLIFLLQVVIFWVDVPAPIAILAAVSAVLLIPAGILELIESWRYLTKRE